MKIGIFDHVERLSNIPLNIQYGERISFVKLAEELGFYSYHVAEHHHSPLTVAPVQGPYLGALASATERIRLCPLVYVLPLHHPIRTIEEICILDNMTHGRLDVGFGRGAPVGDELEMWGGNPEDSDAIYRESLQVILQGLTSDFLNFKGDHYCYQDLWMELKPYQQPYPPLWVAGNPIKAAQMGSNLITEGTIKDLPRTVETYYLNLEKQRFNGGIFHYPKDPLLGVSKRILIADTNETATERARASYDIHLSNYTKPLPGGSSRRPRVMVEREIGARILPWTVDFETAVKQERLIIGSVQKVTEYLRKYRRESGTNFLLLSFQWGNLSHEEAVKSMKLVASEFIQNTNFDV